MPGRNCALRSAVVAERLHVGNPRRVFVIGPVTGATVAAAYYKVINAMQDKEAENEPAADRADDVKPVEA